MQDDWWHERLIAMGFDYIDLYVKGTLELEMIASMPSVRHSIILIYHRLVARNRLQPIESLPPETKDAIWKECRPYTTNLKRTEVIEFVKCYTALLKLAELKL